MSNTEINTAAQVASEAARSANALLSLAQNCKIETHDDAEIVAGDIGTIKSKIKALDDKRKSITKPLDEAKAAIMDLFRSPVDLLTQAEAHYKRAYADWQTRERLRLEAEAAEQRRITDELARQAQAEADRLQEQLQSASLADDEIESIAAQAEASRIEAETIRHLAPTASAPQKVAGLSARENWDFEIVDANLIPREYLMPDEKKIRQIVKAMKSQTNIPGIRAFSDSIISARAIK